MLMLDFLSVDGIVSPAHLLACVGTSDKDITNIIVGIESMLLILSFRMPSSSCIAHGGVTCSYEMVSDQCYRRFYSSYYFVLSFKFMSDTVCIISRGLVKGLSAFNLFEFLP